ncbi:MAG: non-homologous end-joining DNA ligase [Chloroflexi bacterium]|nr:non-homologous end-joining DNA ligase [Chloroflexota bacterium]MBV9600148.1 non-homologous end-joining DNA ligase [Chloroflexota bacterium]
MPKRSVSLEIEGREVAISNPDKVFFPRTGHTKLDLVNYYLAVADGAIRGVDGRPMALKRFVNGAEAEPFFQKRAPDSRPEWIETVELSYPSGRTAAEIVVRDAAQLIWVVNLGCMDLNPHPVRADDLDHPDELRVDLDPVRGVAWPQVREVALVIGDVLTDFGLRGWPKTSGSRGFHVFCRIERRWTFAEVRRAALALAREVERRAPELATSKWWKEERHGVFVDYNQNARDHTMASAYSVRPTAEARVSAPLRWDEVAACEPASFTIDSVPARYAALGDPGDGIDAAVGSLEPLLELFERQAQAGAEEPPARGAFRPGAVPPPAPGKDVGPTGRRRTTAPLIEIARAPTQKEAMEGLERWRARHPEVWPLLAPNDVLVDSMRGRSQTWTRIRVNLRNVPEAQRPAQEPLEVDYDPWQIPSTSPRGRGSGLGFEFTTL